jgi:UDP-glucose 4-epimerase
MSILVTGGAGYIGSHTCLELLQAGFDLLVVDNLSNSKEDSLQRVQQLSGRSLDFVRADLRDLETLRRLFRDRAIEGVVHFAGLKAVGESASLPLEYYDNNIGGTLNLCRAMAEAGVRHLVFSSSATVYGDPASVPVREDFPLSATNPYEIGRAHV